MVTLNQKRKILLMHQNGKNKSEISRIVGISRKTIRKYINDYEEKVQKLNDPKQKHEELNQLIEEMSSAPKYDISSRKSKKLTKEVKKIIDKCLEDNKEKIKTRKRKQVMKKIDIYELLVEKNHDIGYTTVCNYINENNLVKEAYIKQQYDKGDVLEFDWGEVKLIINGEEQKFQLALFSTAYGSYHYARLYNNQKTESFLDIHVRAFKHYQGVYRTVVYDNMKVAVKRFVGLTEKEPTEALLKISTYYGFDFRFCNARRGNEKGHVERGVEMVRRKSFSRNLEFKSLEEANNHLNNILSKINSKIKKYDDNKSAKDRFIEEIENLIPLKPDYVIARKVECRVSKYSAITIEQNRYSVPDKLVNKFVEAKIYPEIIKVYFKNELVATHKRSYKLHDWVLDIRHYVETIKRKPGSLKHSISLQCLEHRLKEIYNSYYTKYPKEFLGLLEIIEEKSLEEVDRIISKLRKKGEKLVTTENIKNIINQKELPIPEALKGNETEEKSIEILEKINSFFFIEEEGVKIN